MKAKCKYCDRDYVSDKCKDLLCRNQKSFLEIEINYSEQPKENNENFFSIIKMFIFKTQNAILVNEFQNSNNKKKPLKTYDKVSTLQRKM